MRKLLVQAAWELLLLISLFWVFSLFGCHANVHKRLTPPLQCSGPEQLYIPPGCYMQKIPNGIKVTCEKNVTIYRCEHE